MDHNARPQPLTDRPLPEDEAAARARALLDDWAQRVPTSYRDPSPVPYVGEAPPVAQPGRPPMSQKATDTSALMLSGSVLVVAVGGAGSGVLLALDAVEPLTLGIAAGGLTSVIVGVGWLVSRLRHAAQAVQPITHHHTYNAPVTRTETTNVTSHTRGLGRTHNGPKAGR